MAGGDPPTLDPALAGDAVSAEYIVEIFSGLVTLNSKLEVVPDLAEKWEISPDGKTYTFTLRKGAKFHNGKVVTAADVKYSLERIFDPRTESGLGELYLGDIVGARDRLLNRAREVSGVKVIDESTIAITIDAPKPYFLMALTYPAAFVVDKENVERSRTWTDKPNGTGPFMLKEYVKGERIILARNENYYGSKAHLQEVRFDLVGGAAMTRYENNELDIVPVGIADIDRVTDPRNPLNKDLRITPRMDLNYIGLNTTTPPFDDVNVRRAFCAALDREKMVTVVYKGTAKVANTILPPGFPGYDPSLQACTYNVDEAKRLIAQSKYKDVSKFPEITYFIVGGGGAPRGLAPAIQESLKQNLGIDVQIQQMEWATYLQLQKRGAFQMFGGDAGWIADYPDPQNFLDILFHTGSYGNDVRYSNPEVDRLLEQARVEQNATQRMKLYNQVERMILADMPIIPISHGQDFELIKPWVKGVTRAPLIIPWLKDVYIEGR
jgi:ABC-type transport system substrate-binding protein